jgi:HlyD family secretion protein
MDSVVRVNHRRRYIVAGMVVAVIVPLLLALRHWMPQGLQVDANNIRIATAQRGVFLDDMIVRANAAPLNSVILDAVESGRVEDVFVRDGATVERDTPLFRLSNPQRQLDLLARQSDQATQISNLSNLRAALEASITDHERRMSDLQFSLTQAEKQYARNQQLAAKGFISPAALDESADRLAQQRHEIDSERSRARTEIEIKRQGLAQMEQASNRLESGLQLMHASIDALTVRAPANGRLTDFHLQVGEAVNPSQHIGRIDDPAHFKLSADVDEYYLSRIAPGRPGTARIGDQSYPVEVTRVYPQIDKGRFVIDMVFSKEQPRQLNPGQSLDTQITLGEPAPALLLPSGAFINDSGGTWVFVVAANGETAERRTIRTGRRSNSQIEVLAGLSDGEKIIVSSYAGFGRAERLQLSK